MRDSPACGRETRVIAGMTETDADAIAFAEGLLLETESRFCVRRPAEQFVSIGELTEAELDALIERRERTGRDVDLLRRYRLLKFRTAGE